MDQVTANSTTIVVAKRLSAIKGADLIAVIKDRAIVKKGRQETLIFINDDAYAFLVALHYTAPS